MQSNLNPCFYWSKRKSILRRVKELPVNLSWRFIVFFLSRGYLYHPDYEHVRSLDNLHSGKTCILIGNGPSVDLRELEKLKSRSDIVTICANRFYLCFPQTSFRPDILVSSDSQMIEDFGAEMLAANIPNVFFASFYRPKIDYTIASTKVTWLKLFHGRPFRFSKAPENGIMSGAGSLIAASQIAYKMGLRQFYLYGVDHNFTYEKVDGDGVNDAKGDGNHFIQDYRSGKNWQAPRMDLVKDAFCMIDKTLREEGGFLKNATNGGNLEVLERAPFCSIYNGNS